MRPLEKKDGVHGGKDRCRLKKKNNLQIVDRPGEEVGHGDPGPR